VAAPAYEPQTGAAKECRPYNVFGWQCLVVSAILPAPERLLHSLGSLITVVCLHLKLA
jgi:hypothetical protein